MSVLVLGLASASASGRALLLSSATVRDRLTGVRRPAKPADIGILFRSRESHCEFEAALERLSETSRAVVWLHDVEGYTHEEIAGMMGKTPSFSKSQLARAHIRLRRWLGEEEGDR